MGIDILFCSECEVGFHDAGDFEECDNCSHNWCDEQCAERGGLEKVLDDEGYQMDSTCKYCRGEDVDDSVLLDFAIRKLGYTHREDLVKEYFRGGRHD